ncbi:MAG: hypothetical protein ACQESF_04960 [Nanobdellota archaeon]
MDVEKLKKVNQLATTLRDKGLADGREEAAMLAGRMNYNGDSGMDRIFTGEESQKQEEPKAREVQESVIASAQEKEGMDEKKIIGILQNFADQFSKEVNSMNDKIQQQEQIINRLQTQIKSMASQQNSQPMQQNTQQSQENNNNNTQATEPKENNQQRQESSQPRSGGYESDDVSIEKFFYYGQN